MNKIFLETIRAIDGEVFNIPYHQQRYENVLNLFGIEDAKSLKNIVNPPNIGTYRCRLIYDISKKPHTINISYHRYKKRDIKSLKLIYDNNIDYSLKSICRDELDILYSLRGECDDILIVRDSLVTDTSIANIAFFDSQRWVTPASPLLKGTTRARLLDAGVIFESDINVEDLQNFSKVALLNAMVDFDIITQTTKEIFC